MPLTGDLVERFERRLSGLAPCGTPFLLAVSGGGDSMAMLRLAFEAPSLRPRVALAATVDHGLRPEAAAEAEEVGRACADLGFAHRILKWEGEKPAANLQAEARAARFRLLAEAAQPFGAMLVLAHTRDDQAETFLLRLARGSGVEGLAAMAARTERAGTAVLRPLLEASREELRDFLRSRGAAWREDPSNENLRFDRVKARAALAALAPLGLGAERLAATAAHLGRAAEALQAFEARLAAEAAVWSPLGTAFLRRGPFLETPREIALRAFAEAFRVAGGAEYPPRFAALEAAFERWMGDSLAGGLSLGGVLLRPAPEGNALLMRESRDPPAPRRMFPGETLIWDGRFNVALGGARPLTLAALGAAGLKRIRETIKGGRAEAWRMTPAFWEGAALIAAPVAGWGDGAASASFVEKPSPFPWERRGLGEDREKIPKEDFGK